ncbi:MAG: mechanosensitive ion channel family protein [Candidatus Methanoplasma sp.]|jgi:small-conductance mechanosensitive channel|nr:mechanosensitive ion channel family protein [Candidatus Methanoplasma sp.]
MRPAKVLAALLAVFAVSVMLLMPAASSDADATEDDVWLVASETDLRINAGSSGGFSIAVTNSLPDGDGIDEDRMISISFKTDPDITASVNENDNDFILDGQESRLVTVTVTVDKYVSADSYDIEIVLEVRSLQTGSVSVTNAPVHVGITVLSPLSSGTAYNQILGIFGNPLPEPFDGPLTTAVLTFILWMIIGMLAVMIFMPVLLRVLARSHKDESEKLKNRLRTLILMVLMLFAFDNSLRVFGASEEIIGSVESLFSIFYIVLGAVIAWRIYLVFVQYTVSKISKGGRIDHKDVDIEPLLRLLGKLVISVMSIAFMMSVWGFNLTAIITSAGIVSLGITLGAQNILNQFFSGMVLLLTHPFRSGDIVKIGSSPAIYKVSSVNIMNTVFENWDNEDTIIMPNNKVSSDTIVNLTGEGLIYKINVYMNVSYDNDTDLAQKIMKDVAMDHPNIITNGSVDLPYTRITAFLDSSIELRLTSYVYDFNDSGKIGGELRESIFKAFKEKGVTVPFPQMDVHINVVRDDRERNGADDRRPSD